MKNLLKELIESIIREEIEEQFFMSFNLDKERPVSQGPRMLRSYGDYHGGSSVSSGYYDDYGSGSWGRYEREYSAARDEARAAHAEREALSEPSHGHGDSGHSDSED